MKGVPFADARGGSRSASIPRVPPGAVRRPAWRALRLGATNLLLAAAALLALEGATRALGLRFAAIARPREGSELLVYDAVKGWRLKPGGTGDSFHGGPDRGVIRVNSLGLRGPEIAAGAEQRGRRVLVLGDSVAFGIGVDEGHSYVAQLAALLEPTGPTEVVNMAVIGYATDQELLLFEELAPRLRFDLVVLVMCDNDFEHNVADFVYDAYYKPFFRREGEELVLANVPVPRLTTAQELRLWFGRESNLWNAFRSRSSPHAGVQRLLDRFQVAVPQPSPEDAVLITLQILERLRARVRGSGAELVLFNSGHRGERIGYYRALRPLLDARGFKSFAFEGHLQQARTRRPERFWDFGSDFHWNVDAHRLAAEVTLDYVRHWQLLGEQPTR